MFFYCSPSSVKFKIFNVYFNLIMKFVLKPSLEHMVLVKIGVSLWSQNDVSALISKFSKYLSQSKMEEIEKRVIDKVLQLSLPQLLKEKLFCVIKPIGMQIFEWMGCYQRFYLQIGLSRDPRHLPAELCWTSYGTVDRKRTAEVLVKDENLNVSKRYRLACQHFLEDDISRLWNRLPQDLKDYDWHNFPVISFWSDNMKRGGTGHISYKRAFNSSVRDGSKVAAKYFLQKLTPQEREECLKDLPIFAEDTDVLCFLLSEMEKEQQMLVFKSDPCGVLWCFLRWPFQGFFIEVANCMWDFLSRDNYDKILGYIIRREGYKDYNYQKLFEEFWQKSPSALKDSFIDEIDRSSLLQYLFDIKDKKSIRFILKDATLTAKKKLIYSDAMNTFCECSINNNEWDFLEFFIRECFPSKNEMLKFKEAFEKCMYFKEYCSATKKQKWNLLFDFSDDSVCKYGKRSIEEGESSSSKRFQSLQ